MSDEGINIPVTADTRNAQLAFTALADKLGDFSFHATRVVNVARRVIDALQGIYKVAREGADIIGGDVAASYDEFDANMQAAADSAKKLLAFALLPLIKTFNDSTTAQDQLREGYRLGIISQDEYADAVTRGRDAQGNWLALSDDTNAALAELGTAAKLAAVAVEGLSKAELALIDVQKGSFDKAMLVSAGIITSTVNAALISEEQRVAALQKEWSTLAFIISGPLAKSAEDFANQFATLDEKTAAIKEEIAELGGLAYMTPEQQANILELRNELIGVAMEIRAIDEEFGDAFDDGKQGKRVLAAKDRMEELREKAWELEQQIIALGSKPYTTAAQLEEIDNLQGELEQIEADILATADAQEEATRRIIFSILEQRIALMGMTDDPEVFAFMEDLAEKWGLVDEQTANATRAADTYLKGITTGAAAVEGGAAAFYAAARELGLFLDEWEGVPEEKTLNLNAIYPPELIDIMGFAGKDFTTTINIDVTGDTVPGSGYTGGASYIPPREFKAHGGHVYDGNAYIVGEQGPELFVPDQGGTIVPNGETSKMTGGGDTTVIVMLDGEQIAANVIRRAGRDARMAHSSGAALTGR